MSTQVFAFGGVGNAEKEKIYNEIKKGNSRFGRWNQIKSLREQYYGEHNFLLTIKKDDWIVHVNLPQYGKCVAAKVIGEYGYDEGIKCEWGYDFNNFIPIDVNSIIEFNRKDPNIIPTVNLKPLSRYHRVHYVQDFINSIENIKNKKFDNVKQEDKNIIHLHENIKPILKNITNEIHKLNKSKDLEDFFHIVFSNIKNVESIQNGYGWKSDFGADLIVYFKDPIFENSIYTLIVQIKSYSGNHFDTKAIDQICTGIKEYNGDAGLLITTAEETKELEEYRNKKSGEINKKIDIISGIDVAKFVFKHAPHLLIGND